MNSLPEKSQCLPGRDSPIGKAPKSLHFTLANRLYGPFPELTEQIYLGMGCFWGAERLFYKQQGVFVTAVGYSGGHTPNPTYEEVCSGKTAHAEVVLVVFEPEVLKLTELLKLFWENHDPTQGMKQGHDIGTQYRSVIYTTTREQLAIAQHSRETYQAALFHRKLATITTEISPETSFYYAEEYHQQYLAKNPNGYCGLGGTGVSCPMPIKR